MMDDTFERFVDDKRVFNVFVRPGGVEEFLEGQRRRCLATRGVAMLAHDLWNKADGRFEKSNYPSNIQKLRYIWNGPVML